MIRFLVEGLLVKLTSLFFFSRGGVRKELFMTLLTFIAFKQSVVKMFSFVDS